MKTEAEFKTFLAGQAGKLADTVFVAKARAQTVREQVDAYIEPIFHTYGFRAQRTGELIAKSSQLYLAGDTTPEQLRFYAACEKAHKEHGFNVPEGCCPALMAESDLVKAENALLKATGEWLGFDPRLLWGEKREQMLDLILGANSIKFRGTPRTKIDEMIRGSERDRIKAVVAANAQAGRERYLGLSSSEIGECRRFLMFGDNDEAFPSQAEWSRIVD